jgi:hypothetical protein
MNNLVAIDNLQSNMQDNYGVAHTTIIVSIESTVSTVELQAESALQSTWSSLSEQF